MNHVIELISIAIFLGIYFWLYRRYSNRSRARAIDGVPVGVGGWLFVLISVLLVIAPLTSLGTLGQATFQGNLERNLTMLASALAIAVNVYGGWVLVRGNRPDAVTKAVAALWISGPVAELVFAIGIPYAAGLDAKVELGTAFIQSLLVAVGWTLYLKRSKRVKLTYAPADS